MIISTRRPRSRLITMATPAVLEAVLAGLTGSCRRKGANGLGGVQRLAIPLFWPFGASGRRGAAWA